MKIARSAVHVQYTERRVLSGFASVFAIVSVFLDTMNGALIMIKNFPYGRQVTSKFSTGIRYGYIINM